jgi:hypothetical protein
VTITCVSVFLNVEFLGRFLGVERPLLPISPLHPIVCNEDNKVPLFCIF